MAKKKKKKKEKRPNFRCLECHKDVLGKRNKPCPECGERLWLRIAYICAYCNEEKCKCGA